MYIVCAYKLLIGKFIYKPSTLLHNVAIHPNTFKARTILQTRKGAEAQIHEHIKILFSRNSPDLV